jgi:uncharacterized protein YkwD
MNRTWTVPCLVFALALFASACHLELEATGGEGGNNLHAAAPAEPLPATIAPYDAEDVAETPVPEPGECGSPMGRAQTELTNRERDAMGLPALRCHDGLTFVAIGHSEDMAERGFFDHINPDGEQPWDRMNGAGVTGWKAAGENIAAGYPTAAAVTDGWMNSPGHRANIMNPEFNCVGVGVYEHQGRLYWTQLFAKF